MSSRKITLRVFSFNNTRITDSVCNVYGDLVDKLENSEDADERAMPLNHEEQNGEKDLISYYKTQSKTNSIFCLMMRIAPREDHQPIPEKLLKKKMFNLVDVEKYTNDNGSSVIIKDHYYFLLGDGFIITNLPGNKTCKSLQAYLSWIVKDELLELTPVILSDNYSMSVNQIKSIAIGDAVIQDISRKKSEKSDSQYQTSKKTISLKDSALVVLKKIFADVDSLSDMNMQQLISAKLLIEFKKPRNMSKEDYDRQFGTLLKPVADLENFVFKDKNNRTIVCGKDILRRKEIRIDMTEGGKISENDLIQEMSKFLMELIYDEKNNN